MRELKIIPADDSNKNKILELMAETRKERRTLIQGMKIKIIMNTFPKFEKYNGLLVNFYFNSLLYY